MGGRSKLKIGRRKAHAIGDTLPHLEVERPNVNRRLMLRGKMRHIFGTGRPTNLKLGVRMEYDESSPCAVTSKVKGQCYCARRHFDARLPNWRKKSQTFGSRCHLANKNEDDCGGAKIFCSALLQPARSVCVSLGAFFHCNKTSATA